MPKVLCKEEKIDQSVKILAEKNLAYFKSFENVEFVVLMKGGKVFADKYFLKLRALGVDIQEEQITLLDAQSYKGVEKKLIEFFFLSAINSKSKFLGKIIIVLDDLCDSGGTLVDTRKFLKQFGPTSIFTITCFFKVKSKKEHGEEPDFWAIKVSDNWLIGFGLDFFGILRKINILIGLSKFEVFLCKKGGLVGKLLVLIEILALTRKEKIRLFVKKILKKAA